MIAELIGKVRILVFLRRALVPLCPRIDRLKLFRRCFVHLCELVQIHQEHVTHLVHERRFIRTLKERDDTLAVLFGDFSPHLLTEHLVELLDDGDRLVVEDNIAAAVFLSAVSNSLNSILIKKYRCFFLPFRKVTDCAVNVHAVRFRQRIHNLGNDF